MVAAAAGQVRGGKSEWSWNAWVRGRYRRHGSFGTIPQGLHHTCRTVCTIRQRRGTFLLAGGGRGRKPEKGKSYLDDW